MQPTIGWRRPRDGHRSIVVGLELEIAIRELEDVVVGQMGLTHAASYVNRHRRLSASWQRARTSIAQPNFT
ncbi:MAG: hypothetical protein KC503_11720 [Myxococcales bacterium]|nr:hypothetical protein [Myxococcales bacterium]